MGRSRGTWAGNGSLRGSHDPGGHPVGKTYDHLSVLADLSLIHTDLIGAGGLGDPRPSAADHKAVDAARAVFYGIFLVLMKIQGLDHGPVHGNFQKCCWPGVDGLVQDKNKERRQEHGSGQKKLPFSSWSVFLFHRL